MCWRITGEGGRERGGEERDRVRGENERGRDEGKGACVCALNEAIDSLCVLCAFVCVCACATIVYCSTHRQSCLAYRLFETSVLRKRKKERKK